MGVVHRFHSRAIVGRIRVQSESVTRQTAGVPVIRIADPGELLASMPQMLGFRPEDSVILIGYPDRRRSRVGPVARCDLPADQHVREVADLMVTRIEQSGAAAATIVVVGGELPRRRKSGGGKSGAATLPHAALVRAIRAGLKRRGLERRDSLWTPEIRAKAPWRCYAHDSCGGVLADPASTVAAATAAGVGLVTLGSREELERQFDLDDEDALRRRSELVDQKLRELDGADEEQVTERAARAVRRALEAALAGELSFSDEQFAELAIALCDVRIRDACLATASPPTSARALAAANLWLVLARALPAPERAEAACLAGYAAYQRGEGPSAGMAFDVALAASPAHLLSGLLKRALECGVDPRSLEKLEQADELSLWADGSA